MTVRSVLGEVRGALEEQQPLNIGDIAALSEQLQRADPLFRALIVVALAKTGDMNRTRQALDRALLRVAKARDLPAADLADEFQRTMVATLDDMRAKIRQFDAILTRRR